MLNLRAPYRSVNRNRRENGIKFYYLRFCIGWPMNRTLTAYFALVILLNSLACPLPVRAQAQTYYVSSAGLDGNDGTSAYPWRTIQHGADQLLPGDTLLIAPGVYQEGGIVVTHGGAAGSPVTFKASGAGVIVDKSGTGSRQDAFFITGVNYVVVDGLTFQNASRAGMRIDSADHVTVRKSR